MDDDKPPWYEFLPTVSAAVDIPSREQVYEKTRDMIDFGDGGIRGDAFDGYYKELVANIEAQNRIECSKNKSSQLTTSASSMGGKEIQRNSSTLDHKCGFKRGGAKRTCSTIFCAE